MEENATPLILDDANMSQGDRAELFGSLIDVVEDWLDSKGITSEMIENPERDEEEGQDGLAIIYGSDYDYLADAFSRILHIRRDMVV